MNSRIHSRTLILVSLLALAACGKATDKKAEEAAEASPAPTVVDQVRIKAGAWDATTEIVSMEISGVDPAMLKSNIGRKTNFKNCVTPEQAERPPADFFAHPDVKSGNCKSEKFDMAGGKLDAVIVCDAGQGQSGPMRMAMAGNYDADAYDLTMTMTGEGAQGAGAMKMVVRSSGRHVADMCEG
ncbi:Protein of unknown function [Sphingomonas laterariae]|uniref:DUF3617 domain-containing protein n=1 Tax=Edaphosphingomonas laterariae TaxID=861865 RepID=A0A239GM92_9SPHN|nr:DUF3617 domain-containing protein [Sphingomonas laterariae]SNS70386.1 Protein of unknown function [Sphingomonas laterariae]